MPDLTFGLGLPATVAPHYDPVAAAQHAEHLGFDFVSTSDHPCGTAPSHETWTMLSWIAAHTTRIRVATRVLGVPYRPPAMVAKMAETFDRLSHGRLILGLGGGYSDDEFRAFGLPVPTPAQKVAGLADAIHIARGLWTQPSFTHTGTRYHTASADLEPKPTHHIPIWLGTYGPRALALTGQLADGWIPSHGSATPDQIPAMHHRITTAANTAGRPPTAVTAIYNLTVHVGPTTDTTPADLTGTPTQIAARLTTFTTLGFTGFNFQPTGPNPADQAERLAHEVIPLLDRAR